MNVACFVSLTTIYVKFGAFPCGCKTALSLTANDFDSKGLQLECTDGSLLSLWHV